MLCLAPIGAQAVTIVNGVNSYSTDGLNVNNMTIGEFTGVTPDDPSNDFYAGPDIDKEHFTILSNGGDNGGDIVVKETLTITQGYHLGIMGSTNPSSIIKKLSFGLVNADGSLAIRDVQNFNVDGAMRLGDYLNVSASDAKLPTTIAAALDLNSYNPGIGAETMTVGGAVYVNENGGDTVIAVNDLSLGGFHNAGQGRTYISSTGNINITGDGDIENSYQSGYMVVKAGGALTVSGNIANSNSEMNIVADTINVTGTIKNDTEKSDTGFGTLVLKADTLTVSGGDVENNNVGFANGGDLIIDVTGTTTITYGFDLSAMGTGNKFSLTTGTLDLGDTGNLDRWLNVFTNKLDDFKLIVNNASFTVAGDINNGQINDTEYNIFANMLVEAQSLTVGNVHNHGESLTLNATGPDKDGVGAVLTTGEVIVYDTAKITKIDSGDKLVVKGAVTNSGEHTSLSGKGSVTISGGVSNSAGTLDIGATTSNGLITFGNNVTGIDGTLNISAREVQINGSLISGSADEGAINSGVINIDASDFDNGYLEIGAVDVNGGVVNLNALKGGIQVNGAIDVAGGRVNVDGTTHNLTAGGTIDIAGNFELREPVNGTGGNGDMYVAASGQQGFNMTSTAAKGAINIGGDIIATQSGSRTAQLSAATINVAGGVDVFGGNKVIFGNDASEYTGIKGDVLAQAGGKLVVYSDDFDANSVNVQKGSALIAYGTQISADGEINFADGLWFGGINPEPQTGTETGLFINGNTTNMTLSASNIHFGGLVDLGNGKQLTLQANGTENPNIAMGGLSITGADTVMNIKSDSVANVMVASGVAIDGGVVQGTSVVPGMLNLMASETNFAAQSLSVNTYTANTGIATFDIDGDITVAGGISVRKDAETTLAGGGMFTTTDVTNAGTLVMRGGNGIKMNDILSNTGNLTLDSGVGVTQIDTFAVAQTGKITLQGAGMTTDGVFTTSDAMLFQNTTDELKEGEVNIVSDKYAITASKFDVYGIDQLSGYMQVNTNDINVDTNIDAGDLRFAKYPSTTSNQASKYSWIDATIGGNVSGGVDFWGLKRLDIGGNYTFNNNSDLWAAIMPYDASGMGNTSAQNYWSKIEATENNKVGEITNAENGGALITVGGQLISNLDGLVDNMATGTTTNREPTVTVSVFDIVDQGTAIWLLHADKGINVADEFENLRNIDVKFCNGDGSVCVNYADLLRPSAFNETGDDLPIYLTERDTDKDGVADSIYIVFDPAFGGPIEVFKIQPIVAGVPSHTDGEYVSAGALDNLIAGQLANKYFVNRTPIELIPEIFKGTNLMEMSQELYDRMNYYSLTGQGDSLARFSRLFQARELEQIAGSIALNEHTNFRDFEDRMFDEFIWNRNRNLNKAWLDVDFGLFSQDASDSKRVKGERFSIAGGFDWQESETMIMGLTARVSNSSSDNSDMVDLTYKPNQQPVLGTVDMNVDDLNIGFGAYLMQILGEKTRLYGNLFLDVHMLDIARDQTFMEHIDGSGTAFSLISEIGLMHDWLNQYIVGNMYARVGYNFGFDITEHAAGQDYMDMQSDGYVILTPGYSLMAQKRIYPSSWFQIRPYASIGVEYDVLGAPDFVKYKFALAHTYTKYDIDIDPLWANIGGGVEFLSASGLQFGIDYRYQYNDAIQLHNIRVSGSYRF